MPKQIQLFVLFYPFVDSGKNPCFLFFPIPAGTVCHCCCSFIFFPFILIPVCLSCCCCCLCAIPLVALKSISEPHFCQFTLSGLFRGINITLFFGKFLPVSTERAINSESSYVISYMYLRLCLWHFCWKAKGFLLHLHIWDQTAMLCKMMAIKLWTCYF